MSILHKPELIISGQMSILHKPLISGQMSILHKPET
jgi:hypothetical protein